MGKKYPIKLLNGNIESTVGVVKKRIGSPRTYSKGNEWFILYVLTASWSF